MPFGFQQSYILLLLTFFEIVQQVYSIKGPTDIKGYIGEDAFFKWNTNNQREIYSASWGIRKGNIADPPFINVNVYTGKVNVNSDLDETIKSRVEFLGNLKEGRAWFVLRNLTVNDTNEYIASISDNEEGDEPYPVRLVVTPKDETKPTEVDYHTTEPTSLFANTTMYSINCPKDFRGYVGEDAVFMWNTTNQRAIYWASWGIRKGNIADPPFINVNVYTGKVNVNSDLDETIKSRVEFLGNLKEGRAWFVLRNLNVNDSNEYIASMSDDGDTVLTCPVSLEVLKNGTIGGIPSTGDRAKNFNGYLTLMALALVTLHL